MRAVQYLMSRKVVEALSFPVQTMAGRVALATVVSNVVFME
jgi:hypothetical protein